MKTIDYKQLNAGHLKILTNFKVTLGNIDSVKTSLYKTLQTLIVAAEYKVNQHKADNSEKKDLPILLNTDNIKKFHDDLLNLQIETRKLAGRFGGGQIGRMEKMLKKLERTTQGK